MLYHPGPNPTVDVIVQKPLNGETAVLLVRRNRDVDTEPGKLAFPGGFIETKAKKGSAWTKDKETEIEAAKRELLEETKLDLSAYKDASFKFLGIYDDPERDPRNTEVSWVEAHVFTITISEKEGGKVKGSDDAEEANWYPLSEVKAMLSTEFAFDHYEILEDHILK